MLGRHKVELVGLAEAAPLQVGQDTDRRCWDNQAALPATSPTSPRGSWLSRVCPDRYDTVTGSVLELVLSQGEE